MIAPRLFQREEWEGRLSKLGCSRFAEPNSGLETGEFWQTKHKMLFIVPTDAQGHVRQDDFNVVMAELAKLKPLDFDE